MALFEELVNRSKREALQEAAIRVEKLMTGSFSTATIREVINTLLGEQGEVEVEKPEYILEILASLRRLDNRLLALEGHPRRVGYDDNLQMIETEFSEPIGKGVPPTDLEDLPAQKVVGHVFLGPDDNSCIRIMNDCDWQKDVHSQRCGQPLSMHVLGRGKPIKDNPQG